MDVMVVWLLWLQKLMKHDSDNDGQITLEEFFNYAAEHDRKLKLFFKKMDRNDDGMATEAINLLIKQIFKSSALLSDDECI